MSTSSRLAVVALTISMLSPGLRADAPAAAQTTQPATTMPDEARALVETVQGTLTLRAQGERMGYQSRLEPALAAMAKLHARFPAVSTQPDLVSAELTLLFDRSLFQNEVTMKDLRQKLADLLADPKSTREVLAIARYYQLNADMATRAQKEPASQPDQLPPWFDEELAKQIAFGKEYKDTQVGKRAYSESVAALVERDGYDKAKPRVDDFFATFPDDRAAQALLLGRLALDQYAGRRDGWDRAKPIFDRLVKQFKDEPVTVEVAARLVMRRLQSDPAGGQKFLDELTEAFAGKEPIGMVWGQLAVMSHQRGEDKEAQARLKVLADKFPGSEGRAAALATVAMLEYQKSGMAAATPYIALLKKEMPKSKFLPQLMATLAMQSLEKDGYEKAAPAIAAVTADYPDAPEVAPLRGIARRYQNVGKPFELNFTAVDGQKVDLAAMRGTPVVVYFWATWCTPCTTGMAHTVDIADKFKAKGVKFVGISLDRDKENLTEYLAARKQPLPWPSYFDGKGFENQFARMWGVTGIPLFLVIDKDGNLVNAGTNDKLQMEETLDKLTGGKSDKDGESPAPIKLDPVKLN